MGLSYNFDLKKRVAIVTAMIPKGKVATYGQIARLCGVPAYSRHVGHALAAGLKDEEGSPVPAHRVLNSQGRLSGADSFETPSNQQERLEAEGVLFTEWRKLDLKKYQWQPTWEEEVAMEDRFAELEIKKHRKPDNP